MWFLTFIYLNVVGTPWLSRWTMLSLFPVLQLFRPSFVVQLCLPLFGGMIVGEVVGRLWVELRETRLSSLTLAWSLAFEDEEKEREYVTKNFEESYLTVTICCAVAIALSCVGASCFPDGGIQVLLPLAFWLGILGLRVHTEENVCVQATVCICVCMYIARM